MSFEEELSIRTDYAEEVIRRYLPEETGLQKKILESSNYAVLAGGKRLRPLLMLETYRLFDGRGKIVEPFMAAIEYIHSMSLVHDDLPCMDNDALRRGKPSVWAAYGEDFGVLAGDALMAYAFETAAKAFVFQSQAVNVGRAMEVLARKTGVSGMIGGQSVDVQMTGEPLTEEQLHFIYKLKTGALIEAAMMCGAILADASREDIAIVEQIAARVGMAFQIRDDILDETSTEEVLGKPVHSDEKNKKTTYVTLYGLDRAREAVIRLSSEAIAMIEGLSGENLFLEALLKTLMTRDK
ncbi:MAG: polyprenyl synthetase family protein [Lachnospiraceae bacterium]|nr:polyprenyl synthetase family protein [Lachnospiraceae bacterium]MBP5254346.1 polyprenyl synthetase family protein [Lachnospiraceae bacterium]